MTNEVLKKLLTEISKRDPEGTQETVRDWLLTEKSTVRQPATPTVAGLKASSSEKTNTTARMAPTENRTKVHKSKASEARFGEIRTTDLSTKPQTDEDDSRDRRTILDESIERWLKVAQSGDL